MKLYMIFYELLPNKIILLYHKLFFNDDIFQQKVAMLKEFLLGFSFNLNNRFFVILDNATDSIK